MYSELFKDKSFLIKFVFCIFNYVFQTIRNNFVNCELLIVNYNYCCMVATDRHNRLKTDNLKDFMMSKDD